MMITELVSRLISQKRKTETTAAEEYLGLVRKSTSTGMLDNADSERIVHLADRLRKSEADLAQDFAAVKAEQDAFKRSATFDAASGTSTTVENNLRAFDAKASATIKALEDELTATRAKLAAERGGLEKQRNQAEAAVRDARAAGEELQAIYTKHAVLFCKEEEVRQRAEAARRRKLQRHLLHDTPERQDPKSGLSVYLFEAMLKNSSCYGELASIEWVIAPGQSQEEFDNMVSVVGQLNDRTRKDFRYLIPGDKVSNLIGIPRHMPHGHLTYSSSDLVDRYADLIRQPERFDPHVAYIIHPGQKKKDLDWMWDQLKAAFAKWQKSQDNKPVTVGAW